MANDGIQAVLFDLGGTLLHYQDKQQADFRELTMRGILRLHAALPDFAYQPPPESEFGEVVNRHVGAAYMKNLTELRGGSIETPLRSALEELGMSIDDEQWAEMRKHFYSVVDDAVYPRAGARSTLLTLHERGLKLALISNTYWAADVHDRHLQQYDLLDLLPQRTYSDKTRYIKPHPTIFTDALAALSVEPQQAVYVGDKLDTDIGGAQAVGMRAVLISSPYVVQSSDQTTRDITPDATIEELPELLDRLTQWQ